MGKPYMFVKDGKSEIFQEEDLEKLRAAAKALVRENPPSVSGSPELADLSKALRKLGYLIPEEGKEYGNAMSRMYGAVEKMVLACESKPGCEAFLSEVEAFHKLSKKGTAKRQIDGTIEVINEDGRRTVLAG